MLCNLSKLRVVSTDTEKRQFKNTYDFTFTIFKISWRRI